MQSKQLEGEMSKVDWATAPEGAEFYAFGTFQRLGAFFDECAWQPTRMTEGEIKLLTSDYEPRPKEWPASDERISAIAQNGGDGLHYLPPCNGLTGEQLSTPKTSPDYLSACLQVQAERGKQYDATGTGERSFAAAASAFNAVTGRDLKGSDVCLMLEMVKLVRQYSSPDRLHADSVLDKVSYSSLWAEQLTSELQK